MRGALVLVMIVGSFSALFLICYAPTLFRDRQFGYRDASDYYYLQYCNIIYLIGAAWLPLGLHAVDRWVRLGRRWGVLELAFVLSMQTLGGDPQGAYLLGLAGIGYALGLCWSRARVRNMAQAVKQTGFARKLISLAAMATALVVWCALTLELARWLPKMRGPGSPPPPLRWMIS
jgi:hypothetical protein